MASLLLHDLKIQQFKNLIYIFIYNFQLLGFPQIFNKILLQTYQNYFYTNHFSTLRMFGPQDLKLNNLNPKVNNVQKNFLYECQICYQDYDSDQHRPLIVCTNYHVFCSKCVAQKLFKKQYDEHKNHTGKYLCSKCSQIINKGNFKEHRILKEVCEYVKQIKKKDEEVRREFYNQVGSMGMNLVAMREDFDSMEKNNFILEKENSRLVAQNLKLRQQYEKLEKIKGTLEERENVQRQIEQYQEKVQILKATLASINDQIRKLQKQETIKANQLNNLRRQQRSKYQNIQQLKITRNDLQVENERTIDLKKRLEQEIQILKLKKKQIQQQNQRQKVKNQRQKMLISSKLQQMKKIWNCVDLNQHQNYLLPKKKEELKQNVTLNVSNQQQQNMKKQIHFKNKPKSQLNEQKRYKQKRQSNQKPIFKALIDMHQKCIKHLDLSGDNITVISSNLRSYLNLSFQNLFQPNKISYFSIKINNWETQSMMVGLMTQNCIDKRDVYNKLGFVALQSCGKLWYDGQEHDVPLKLSLGDVITVQMNPLLYKITWKHPKTSTSIKIPKEIQKKPLYPVLLLRDKGDQITFVQFSSRSI